MFITTMYESSTLSDEKVDCSQLISTFIKPIKIGARKFEMQHFQNLDTDCGLCLSHIHTK